MAQEPSPIKLFQIEEPGGTAEAEDGFGMAVGIELSKRAGASVAAAIGGNAELIVRPGPDGFAGTPTPAMLGDLLSDLRSLAEKAVARPVTHAVIRIDGFEMTDAAIVAAAARAGLALLGVKRDGGVLDAAIEAEDLAAVLSD